MGVTMNGIREFVSENKKKVLVIEGWGMQDVITLSMLSYLESESKKPVHEIFDIVSGVGTGSVIATLIALGMSANEIMEKFYLHKYRNFLKPTLWRKFKTLINSQFRTVHNHDDYIRMVYSFIGEKTFGDVQDVDLILSYDENGCNKLVTTIGENSSEWRDKYIIDVLKNTLEYYFKKQEFIHSKNNYQTYNNYTLNLANEFMTQLGKDYGYVDNRIIMLHLTSGVFSNSASTMSESYMIRNVHVTSLSYLNRIDVRSYTPALTLESLLRIGVSYNRIMEYLHLLSDSATDDNVVSFMRDIGYNYANYINWNRHDTLSWDTIGGVKDKNGW